MCIYFHLYNYVRHWSETEKILTTNVLIRHNYFEKEDFAPRTFEIETSDPIVQVLGSLLFTRVSKVLKPI